MRDIAHHIKKLNRRVIRSMHREEMEEASLMPSPPNWPTTAHEARKKEKVRMRQERESRTPNVKTPEEKNKLMKHRVPIFDRTSKYKSKAPHSRKKSPGI